MKTRVLFKRHQRGEADGLEESRNVDTGRSRGSSARSCPFSIVEYSHVNQGKSVTWNARAQVLCILDLTVVHVHTCNSWLRIAKDLQFFVISRWTGSIRSGKREQFQNEAKKGNWPWKRPYRLMEQCRISATLTHTWNDDSLDSLKYANGCNGLQRENSNIHYLGQLGRSHERDWTAISSRRYHHGSPGHQ